MGWRDAKRDWRPCKHGPAASASPISYPPLASSFLSYFSSPVLYFPLLSSLFSLPFIYILNLKYKTDTTKVMLPKTEQTTVSIILALLCMLLHLRSVALRKALWPICALMTVLSRLWGLIIMEESGQNKNNIMWCVSQRRICICSALMLYASALLGLHWSSRRLWGERLISGCLAPYSGHFIVNKYKAPNTKAKTTQ